MLEENCSLRFLQLLEHVIYRCVMQQEFKYISQPCPDRVI